MKNSSEEINKLYSIINQLKEEIKSLKKERFGKKRLEAIYTKYGYTKGAKILNISTSTFGSKLNKAGVTRVGSGYNPNTKSVSKKLLAHYYKTLKVSQICSILSISESTLRNWLKKEGIKGDNRKLGRKTKSLPIEDIKNQLDSGISPKDLCKKYQISYPTLLKKLKMNYGENYKIYRSYKINRKSINNLHNTCTLGEIFQ